jgi:hypothetical protein
MDEFKHCMLDEDAKKVTFNFHNEIKCFTAIMKEVNQLIQDK